MNDAAWGLEFIPERCIQCYACEAACKAWRAVEPGIKWRRVELYWAGEYPSVSRTAVSLACLHCAEPACMEACPFDAISKRDSDGLVLVDRDKCTGCRLCFKACPFGVPQFGPDKKMQKCDLCVDSRPESEGSPVGAPPCVSTCPTQALVWKRRKKSEQAETERSVRALRGR